MAIFFYRGGYSPEAWGKLIAHPQDVSDALTPSIERFGGKVIACFILFATNAISGAQPGGFLEFPDNASAVAWIMFLKASGILTEAEITPAITTQEGLAALQRIGSTSSKGADGW